ncbi:hypothetical protein QAD02_014331, partial [Eretmocerus hayati]
MGVVKMPADSTVRSQDSSGSAESKESLSAKGSESVVLVTFGVLVLVNGASLGGSGAGLWAGAAALAAGALGLVASLAGDRSDSNNSGSADVGLTLTERRSGFSSAHLAASLVALALANLAAITALTAVVRDSQRPLPDLALLTLSDGSEELAVEEGWSGLLASIGLLVSSVAELIVAGYTCVILAPKLCDCLRRRPQSGFAAANYPDEIVALDGSAGKAQLKTRNMVQQWVIAQSPTSPAAKGHQPFYVVQPILQPVHPAMMQPPYGMVGPPGAAISPGKFAAGGYLPAGALPMLPAHLAPYTPAINRPPSHH